MEATATLDVMMLAVWLACVHQVFFVRLDWGTLWRLAFHKQPDFSVQNSCLRQCQTKKMKKKISSFTILSA